MSADVTAGVSADKVMAADVTADVASVVATGCSEDVAAATSAAVHGHSRQTVRY